MKDKIKAGLGNGLYAGLVYVLGCYLGYRLGKSQGVLEAHIEHTQEQIEKDLKALHDEFPECFNDEES